MCAAMPGHAQEILDAVRTLAKEGVAVELEGGDRKQPLTFVDVYRIKSGVVAHVVYYGEGEPDGLRLRVAGWLAGGEGTLCSPHLGGPVRLKRDEKGVIELPRTFGRYAAIQFGR